MTSRSGKVSTLVDTMGLLLAVCVHRAGRSDHAGLTLLAFFCASFWSCLQLIWVDSTFGGEAMIYAAMVHLMLRRLAPSDTALLNFSNGFSARLCPF